MKNSLNLFDSDSLKDFHKRIFFSMIIFLFVYIIAIYRITDVMLFSSNIEFKEVLQKTSVRGKILDINGNLLATTVKSNSLSTNPNKIKNKAKLANQLSLILNIEKEKIINEEININQLEFTYHNDNDYLMKLFSLYHSDIEKKQSQIIKVSEFLSIEKEKTFKVKYK